MYFPINCTNAANHTLEPVDRATLMRAKGMVEENLAESILRKVAVERTEWLQALVGCAISVLATANACRGSLGHLRIQLEARASNRLGFLVKAGGRLHHPPIIAERWLVWKRKLKKGSG